jgi:hypothetical protein
VVKREETNKTRKEIITKIKTKTKTKKRVKIINKKMKKRKKMLKLIMNMMNVIFLFLTQTKDCLKAGLTLMIQL